MKNSKNLTKIEKICQKCQKSEISEIAHEIYRKKKKGGHASAIICFVGMHFSTKKKTQK
jgi:transcriptional regulatory protein LevR